MMVRIDPQGRSWRVQPTRGGYFVLQVMANENDPFYGVWDDYCHRSTEAEAWACQGMLDGTAS